MIFDYSRVATRASVTQASDMGSETYLRFIIPETDDRTKKMKGLFTVAYELRDSDLTPNYTIQALKEALAWFEKNVPVPEKFSKKRVHQNKDTLGLSWIKAEASEACSKMYEIKSLIEGHGMIVEVIKSQNPGYIVYEDDYQIVAEPFK